MKDYLQSKHFCPLPWVSLTGQPDGKISACHRNRGKNPKHILGDISKDKFSQVWNSSVIRELRRNMIADIPSDFCTRCYEDEDIGERSLRKKALEQYQKGIPRYIKSTDTKGNYRGEIEELVLLTSNICNLACRMCDSYASYQRKGIDISLGFKYAYERIEGNYDTPIFWDDVDMFKNLKSLYVAAGEPFLDPSFFQIISHLRSLGFAKNISFSTMTNLTVLPGITSDSSLLPDSSTDICDFLSVFKQVYIGVSIDGMEETYNKIRIGGRWELVSLNLSILSQKIQKYGNISLILKPVIQMDNILGFPKFYIYARRRGYQFDIHFITRPQELNIQNLPVSVKSKIRDFYTTLIDSNASSFSGLEKDFQNILLFMDGQAPKIKTYISYKKYSSIMDEYQEKTSSTL